MIWYCTLTHCGHLESVNDTKRLIYVEFERDNSAGNFYTLHTFRRHFPLGYVISDINTYYNTSLNRIKRKFYMACQ